MAPYSKSYSGNMQVFDFPNGDVGYIQRFSHGVVYWEYADGGNWVINDGIENTVPNAETMIISIAESFNAFDPNCWE